MVTRKGTPSHDPWRLVSNDSSGLTPAVLRANRGEKWSTLPVFDALRFAVGSASIGFFAIATHFTDIFRYLAPFQSHTLERGSSIAALLAICLAVSTTFLIVRIALGKGVGFANGMATSEVAIGLYASPYLQFHRGMLLATVAVCVLTALWHVILRKSYVRLVATSAICIALFSYLTLILGLVGTVPIAVSRVSLGTQEQVSERDVSDTLRDLHEGTPLRMRGYQEIVDTLQRFAHIESARLGIVEHEPQVVISLIGTASGSNIPTSNRICVNPLVFADGYEGSLEELIELIAHECAHAYEHCVVSGKIPGSYDSPLGTMTPNVAEQWAREFSSPDQAYIDWFAYMMQDTEIRASDYAEGAADRYYDAAGIGLVIGDFRAARDVPGHIG